MSILANNYLCSDVGLLYALVMLTVVIVFFVYSVYFQDLLYSTVRESELQINHLKFVTMLSIINFNFSIVSRDLLTVHCCLNRKITENAQLSTDIDKSTIDLLNKKIGKLENDIADNSKTDGLKIATLEQQVRIEGKKESIDRNVLYFKL